MKKIIQISVILLVSSSAFSQKLNDKQAIVKLLNTQATAWNNADWQGFMAAYQISDSLLFIGKSGITYGWNATLERYKKSYPDKDSMGFLTFDIKQIEVFKPQRAWVLGEFHLKREKKGAANGIFTLLLKKIKGNWLIIADHTTGY